MTIASLPLFGAAIVAAAATPSPTTTATHADFVAWARSEASIDPRIVDFLAQREDCAGAAPGDWTRLARIGMGADFQALLGDERRAITIALVGDEGFEAYAEWARANPSSQG